MSEVLDQAGKVREGEELDPKIITDYVKSVVPDVKGEAVITQFPGGASTSPIRSSSTTRITFCVDHPLAPKPSPLMTWAANTR